MTAKQKAARAKFKAVVAEASKLRKKNPKLTQAQAVKQAWAIEYSKKKTAKKSAKKVGSAKKQTGKTDKKRDKLFQAKKPGKRKTAWGTTYTEKRSNRSDKGKLLGIGAAKKSKVKAKKGRSTEMHTDTKSHNVNIRVVSGMPKYQDENAAREIQLYADNDSQLYYQRRKPIILNLQKKYQKGTYDIDKAAKLWRYYIDAAMQKYHKEFGSRGDKWFELLSVPDRNLLALDYARSTKAEFDLGNFI